MGDNPPVLPEPQYPVDHDLDVDGIDQAVAVEVAIVLRVALENLVHNKLAFTSPGRVKTSLIYATSFGSLTFLTVIFADFV